MIRLQQLRLDQGLNVTQLSDAADVSRKTILHLERNEPRTANPEVLGNLARHLGCSPSELLAPAVFSTPTPTSGEAA